MTKKVKDAVKQVAAKVETLEKKNDKPVIAKPVIKPTQTRSDNDASEKNSDDDDVNDDNDNADDEDATVSKYIISTTGLAYYYFFYFYVPESVFRKEMWLYKHGYVPFYFNALILSILSQIFSLMNQALNSRV